MKKKYLNKLLNMESSLKFNLNNREDNDIADINIDDLIAYVLLNYLYNTEKDNSHRSDIIILSAIRDYYNNKIFTVKDIKKIISDLDSENITNDLFELLFTRFVINEKMIDSTYILKSYDLDDITYKKLLNNEYILKNEKEKMKKYIEKSYNNIKYDKDLLNKIEFKYYNLDFENEMKNEIEDIKHEINLIKTKNDFVYKQK